MATIRKVPSGKYQAIVRKQGNKPLSKTFRTKAMAERWSRKVEGEIEEGTFQDTSAAENMLMSELIDMYRERITPRKKGATQEVSKLRLLKEEFGDVSVARLTAPMIIAFADKRLENFSGSTVNKDINTLSDVINKGIHLWGVHIKQNPVDTARKVLNSNKSLKEADSRNRRLTAEEEALIRSYNPVLSAVVGFALETAMRRGEIANAKRADLTGNTLKIPDTKTGKSRTIPLSGEALRLIKEVPTQFDGSLFGLSSDKIGKMFITAREAAGIQDLRFHDLRHEATSRLFERGFSIEEVASVTGHATWKMLTRYTHLKPEDLAIRMA